MPSLYDLKPAFQDLLRPVIRLIAKTRITPNQVTLSALVLSMTAGSCIALFPGARWPLILLGPALIVRMALNAIDGMLARELDMRSAKGAMLNEMGDVASDSAMYLPLALVPGFEPRLVVIAVLLAVLTETTGIVAAQIGASRNYKGPLGKSDRAFAFGLVSMLIGLGVPTGRWLDFVLAIMVVLLVMTIMNRVRAALGEVRSP